MSFILDALKKSEGQRQRQSGPALFEVKVAPPRTRVPLWAVAVGLLLIVNVGILGWVVLRPSAPAAIARTQPVLASPAAADLTAAQGSSAGAAAGAASPPARPARDATAPESPGGSPSSRAALEEAFEPELVGDYGDELPLPEEEPAGLLDAPARPQPARDSRVTRGTALGIPTYEQLLGGPGPELPDLRLDLHVFASDPGARFVFVNNTRLGEGEALPNGTRVESIVPDGAVLSVRGTRFLLQRQ